MGDYPVGMRSIAKLAICVFCLTLTSCASRSVGPVIDYIPHWAGGEPAGLPPRPGTPEYDAYTKQRAKDAATPKAPTPKVTAPKASAPTAPAPNAVGN
jgi:hypothetical protein